MVDSALRALDIKSRDRAAEIGLSQRVVDRPLVPSRTPGRWTPSETLILGVAGAYRRSRSFLFGEPFSFSPGTVEGRSRYYALRLTADYTIRNVDQVFAASLTITRGLDGTRSDVPGVATPNESFLAGLLQLNYVKRLNPRGLELRGRLTGQFATSVLYSGERLSTGGEFSVRGYRENLLLSDEGLIGSLELAQGFSFSGKGGERGGFDAGAFSAAVFFDGAYVNNVDVPDPPRQKIYSVGASLTWTPSPAVFARVSYAKSLRDVARTGSRDIQDRGFQFRVTIYPLKLLRI